MPENFCVCGYRNNHTNGNFSRHKRTCKILAVQNVEDKLDEAETTIHTLKAADVLLKMKDSEISRLVDEKKMKDAEISRLVDDNKNLCMENTKLKSKIEFMKNGVKRTCNRRTNNTWNRRLKVASDQKYKCKDPFGKCSLPDLLFVDGVFDLDHKVPYHVSQDDSYENLQALCPSCHRLKTIDDRNTYPY